MVAEPHPLNRHLFIADNLNLLRSLDNESIDLICIDPPFAKNQTWVGNLRPQLTDAERRQELEMIGSWGINNAQVAAEAGIDWPSDQGSAKFKDIWRWENDVYEDWVERIDSDYPALAKVIDATRAAHSEGTAAYLTYMAIRAIEMTRVLKPNGSLYLHCDHDANGYLRMTLDALFGHGNMRNEIVWFYHDSPGRSRRYFPRKHDTIFFYTKSETWTFNSNEVLVPVMAQSKERYKYSRTIGGRDYPQGTGNAKGKIPEDVWQIPVIKQNSRQATGYPTQKPVALAERIILASSNPGDVVLDCFAGCAYVPVAAERNGRQWIACDMSPRALTVLRRQFTKFHYSIDDEQNTVQPALISAANVTTRGPHQLPERTDYDPVPRYDFREPPEPTFKVPASIIPNQEMLEFLLSLSDYTAWCCGFANRRVDGSVVETTRNFHLDHLDPKSKEGSNQIINRAPLCPHHNIKKNKRRVHLADYRQEIADAGEMMVDNVADLVNLAWAEQQAMDYYAVSRTRLGIQLNLAK